MFLSPRNLVILGTVHVYMEWASVKRLLSMHDPPVYFLIMTLYSGIHANVVTRMEAVDIAEIIFFAIGFCELLRGFVADTSVRMSLC